MTAKRFVCSGSRRTATFASVAVVGVACVAATSHAAVLTGTMTDVGLNDFFFNSGVFGDGVNGVEFIAGFGWWAADIASGGMWFYGSEFNYEDDSPWKSQVAFVPDVLDVSLITDASAYAYTTGALDTTVAIAGGPLLFGSQSGLVLLRNEATGHYGALRLDGMRVDNPFSFDADGISITWWFQTDGTGDFSSVPAPAAAPLFLAGALAGGRRRRR